MWTEWTAAPRRRRPVPVEELAALAGADVVDVRAVLTEVVTEGLSQPASASPGDPSTN